MASLTPQFKTEINLGGLLEHQLEATAELIRINARHRVSLDASDMGVGKTYMGAALARQFDEPTLVVCPLSVIPSWERAGQALGVEFDILNYEKLRTGNTPYLTRKPVSFRDPNTGKTKTYNRFEWAPEVQFVLFDEVHRCAGMTSDQSKMLVRAKAQGKRIHMMSGTPAESPLKMKALGYALDLFQSPGGWMNWARRHGCKKAHFGGFDFIRPGHTPQTLAERAAMMARINSAVFPGRGVRLRVDELPNFPEVSRSVELIGLPTQDAAKIEALYREMKAELEAIDAKGLGENEAIRLMRQLQTVEILKVPGLVEMTEDAIDSGKSVALFVNYRDTVKALAARLKTDCVIWGDQPPSEREQNRKNFQDNTSRVIVCVAAAGGTGLDLHDIHGRFPVLSLVCPGWSGTLLKQTLFRNHRTGAKSKAYQKILFADKTPEVRLYNALRGKVNSIDSLCDGFATAIMDLTTGRLVVV